MSLFTDMNFNLDKDVKEDPLVPEGKYNGNVTGVRVADKIGAISIEITLQENPGAVMTDGTTPIDGARVEYLIWLPKPGDENLSTRSGRQSKAQWKINNMAKCFNKMGVEAKTPGQIMEAIENQEWIGISGMTSVGINEYNGNVNNRVEDFKVEIETF